MVGCRSHPPSSIPRGQWEPKHEMVTMGKSRRTRPTSVSSSDTHTPHTTVTIPSARGGRCACNTPLNPRPCPLEVGRDHHTSLWKTTHTPQLQASTGKSIQESAHPQHQPLPWCRHLDLRPTPTVVLEWEGRRCDTIRRITNASRVGSSINACPMKRKKGMTLPWDKTQVGVDTSQHHGPTVRVDERVVN